MPRVSGRRDQVVKVRYSVDELAQLDLLWRSANAENCASYVRRKSLQPQIGSDAIADLIGKIGLTLNALEPSPKQLRELSRNIQNLVLELRYYGMS